MSETPKGEAMTAPEQPTPPRKTEFWWACIHGADPEPVEKTEHEGRPCVYTCGCADPFYLDEQPCPVAFVSVWPEKHMERPAHPDKQAAAQADHQLRHKLYARHGWRGPR